MILKIFLNKKKQICKRLTRHYAYQHYMLSTIICFNIIRLNFGQAKGEFLQHCSKNNLQRFACLWFFSNIVTQGHFKTFSPSVTSKNSHPVSLQNILHSLIEIQLSPAVQKCRKPEVFGFKINIQPINLNCRSLLVY